MSDRFEDLRTFVQVVDSGTLTRAAEQLGVATSAISRRIKDLEARLGTQLLQRTTRAMRLTPQGERLHRRATEILAALDEAEAEAGDQARALSGPLRIAAPLSFGQTHLAPVLIAFAKAHPGLVLDVDLSDRVVDLIAEGHDLAIRIGQLGDSSLIARKLAEIPMVVAAAPGFWRRHGMPERPEDLAGLPALIYAGSERRSAWRHRAPDGSWRSLEMTTAMRASNGDILAQAAAEGLGVTIQPRFIVERYLAAGTLVQVLQDIAWPSVTVHAIYPATRHLTARARAFLDFARAELAA